MHRTELFEVLMDEDFAPNPDEPDWFDHENVRVCVDDDDVVIHVFTLDARVLLWTARFSYGTPSEVFQAALQSVLDLEAVEKARALRTNR